MRLYSFRYLSGAAVKSCLLAVGVSLLASLSADAAIVGTTLQSWSTSPGWRADGETTLDRSMSSPGGGVADSYTSPSGLGFTTATSTFGAMGLRVSRDSYAEGYQGFGLPARSIASAYWFDRLQINSPGLNGTTGRATISFTIQGGIETSGSGFVADLRYRFAYGTAEYDPNVGALGLGAGILNTEQLQEITFTYGVPFSLALTIGAAVEVNNAFAGKAVVNVSAQSWGGIQGVKDAGGNVVGSYTVSSSESGADYSQAIPEPASAIMVIVGSAFLTSRRRRK